MTSKFINGINIDQVAILTSKKVSPNVYEVTVGFLNGRTVSVTATDDHLFSWLFSAIQVESGLDMFRYTNEHGHSVAFRLSTVDYFVEERVHDDEEMYHYARVHFSWSRENSLLLKNKDSMEFLTATKK